MQQLLHCQKLLSRLQTIQMRYECHEVTCLEQSCRFQAAPKTSAEQKFPPCHGGYCILCLLILCLLIESYKQHKCPFHTVQAAVSSSEWQVGHMLDWMLRPYSTEHFVKQHLDQRPLHIKRQQHQAYFDGLLTKSDIHHLLKTQQLQYGTNVDVTSYTDGKRRNLNHNGMDSTAQPEVASAATVMRRFDREGCSVRILHPQRWVEPIYKLLSFLEDELRSPVGCNAYLTPPSSQGFAPHWDDIDAFVLQVEVQDPTILVHSPHPPAVCILFTCLSCKVLT